MISVERGGVVVPEVRQDWQHEVECAHCHDRIYSKFAGQMRWCKCGKIAVDQTPYYTRMIGNKEDFYVPPTPAPYPKVDTEEDQDFWGVI